MAPAEPIKSKAAVGKSSRKVDPMDLETMRHSAAHLLAAAVLELYPKVKFGIGPAIENGFYYDFDFGEEKISEADLAKIEEKMRKLQKEKISFEKFEVSADEARSKISNSSQKYKLELLEEIKSESAISFYKTGAFIDLCRGPHVKQTGEIGPFKLTSLAGAYWRGNEKNPVLTRIYGTAFATAAELETYLKQQEEMQKRDHRRLGRELELFAFAEEAGAGLPLWLPAGTIIRDELEKWAKETEKKYGYQRVATPHITKRQLYEISGHIPYYMEDMYAPLTIEDEEYFLKPMNCPHHHLIFKSRSRSYRELPLRLAEYGQLYRFERSGTLQGLLRVRGFCQNDAHLYLAEKDVLKEFINVLEMHRYYYEKLGIKNFKVKLGLRDPQNLRKKYHGDEKMWEKAEKLTRAGLEQAGISYAEDIGGAAHYGPKGDIIIESVIGKEYAIGTVQIDFWMPQRFNLVFTNEKGQSEQPVVIHRAPLGSHERMVGFLIEHFAGNFPLWLAPTQVIVLPVSEQNLTYAQKTAGELRGAVPELRLEIDARAETLNAKIRHNQLKKIPYLLIVGRKEEETKTVSLRLRSGETLNNLAVAEIIDRLKERILTKSLTL